MRYRSMGAENESESIDSGGIDSMRGRIPNRYQKKAHRNRSLIDMGSNRQDKHWGNNDTRSWSDVIVLSPDRNKGYIFCPCFCDE